MATNDNKEKEEEQGERRRYSPDVDWNALIDEALGIKKRIRRRKRTVMSQVVRTAIALLK